MFDKALDKVINYEDLNQQDMIEAIENIMEGKLSHGKVASFLTALRMKGVTAKELTAAAKVMRAKANHIEIQDPHGIDIVGTGGDKLNTFNVSTTTAFVVAASGVTVAKHGNRAVSSKCGSADLLEGLGVNINLPPNAVAKCIDEVGIGFLFAQSFHSAMKHVAPIRSEMGIRTVFNLLGPLTNPASVKYQVTGVFNPDLTELFGETLMELGVNKGLVVCGHGNMDELTVTGANKVTEISGGKINTFTLEPKDLGFEEATIEDIQGGTKEQNIEITLDILRGEKGPKRDMVLLNAGCAIYVSGKVKSIEEGIELAAETIDTGKAFKKLEDLISFTNGEEAKNVS